MEKTTLYIASDVHRQLQDLARREQRPQAQLIREALTAYIAAKSPPWPSSIGMGKDGEIAATEAKHWVHAQWDRERYERIRP
jgi:predicted transcriptional regulator